MGIKADILIQARLGSTRLPGKVLKDIAGLPMLVRTFRRIRKTLGVTDVVVITTTNSEDDAIVEVCRNYGIPVLRGSENDCLDRHYQAAKILKSDLVFKIPSDCPFSDPIINADVVSLLSNGGCNLDYVSNYHPPTFPDGLDIEGCRFDVLEVAWREAVAGFQREHTFPFIWDNPEKFSIANYVNKYGNMFMTHRWTLDYLDDYLFVERVYKEFGYEEEFYFTDILKVLIDKPTIAQINAKYAGVNWYQSESHNLKTITKDQYRAT